MKRLFITLFILWSVFNINNVYGQLTFNLTHNLPNQTISVCADTVTFELTILTQASGGSNSNLLTIDLGPGGHYIPGSIMVTSTSNGSTMISPTITVTENNISNDNAPIFDVSDLAFADQFTITYQIALDCDLIGQPVANNIVSATMTGSAGTKTQNSDEYNASNGVMNILPNGGTMNHSLNLNYASGIVGATYTRTLRVRNGGSGVKSFMFYDTTGIGLVIMPISGGTIISTTTMGNNVIRIYEITDFTSIGNNDGIFDTNETFEIVQDVEIVSCENLTSRFGANFGCYGKTSCGNVTGTTRIGGASLNPSVQPNLTVTLRRSQLVCLDDARTGTIVLKNTGTDAATNVVVTLYKSTSTTASNFGTFGYLDIASINYELFNSGVSMGSITPALMNVLNNTTGPGCGLGLPRQAAFTIPSIPPGDSVRIEADIIGCCGEPCTNNRFVRDGLSFFASYTNSCNTSTRNIAPQTVLNRNSFSNEFLINSPTDINDGETFSVTLETTIFSFSEAVTPYIYYQEITMPPGVVLSGDPDDIDILRPNGAPFSPKPSITFMGNKVIIAYPNGNTPSRGSTVVFNNLTADCSQGSGGVIDVDGFLETDPSCSCRPNTFCKDVSIQLHCPSPCPLGGMLNRGYKIQRVNLGPTDNDNNGIPDSPQGAYSANVKTGYAVHGDTVRSEFIGIVSVTGSSPVAGFSYGFAIDSSAINSKMNPISARVVISQPGGTQFDCGNIPTGKNGNYTWADFSISNLTSCGYGPTFIDGDTVRVFIDYEVVDPIRYIGVNQYDIKTRFYLSDQSYLDRPFTNPSDARMYHCDNYSGSFGLVGLYDASNGARSLTHSSCDTLVTQLDYYLGVGPSQYYSGGNFFKDEYRTFSFYDQFTLVKPVGYSYHRATLAYYYNGTNIVIPIVPIDPNAAILEFDIAPLF